MLEWAKFLAVDAAPMALDYAEKRGAPFATDAFTETYSGLVREGIDILLHLREADSATVTKGAQAILIALGSVVRAYYRGNSERASNTNANIMLPHPPSEALLDRAKFCRKDRKATSFGCFL